MGRSRRVTDPASMRRSYSQGELDDLARRATWISQLQTWFDEAVANEAVVEANAIQLATVDAAGHPSVRTVLAKGIDARGIVFYTNYGSAKARELAESPYASAVFAWLPMERQVRLSGPVEKITRVETEAYFATRPRGSQIAAWASEQSSVIDSRERARGGSAVAGGAIRRNRTSRRRRTGAGTGSVRTSSSSGRAGLIGCTTACATGSSREPGSSSG